MEGTRDSTKANVTVRALDRHPPRSTYAALHVQKLSSMYGTCREHRHTRAVLRITLVQDSSCRPGALAHV